MAHYFFKYPIFLQVLSFLSHSLILHFPSDSDEENVLPWLEGQREEGGSSNSLIPSSNSGLTPLSFPIAAPTTRKVVSSETGNRYYKS